VLIVITRDEAIDIAVSHLKHMSTRSGIELQLMDKETLEKDFGWVFCYDSQAYISSGDLSQALAGNAPFIVDECDGTIHETGTAEPLEYYLERYRDQKRRVR
jgi:hypothetical protein